MWIRTLTLFLLFLAPVTATAFNISLRPSEVAQGDAFLVIVEQSQGNKNTLPVGRFAGRKTEKIIFTKKITKNFRKKQTGLYFGLSSVERSLSPGRYPIEVEFNGQKRSVDLTVLDASFRVERLSLPEDKVTLSPKNAARADRESARLKKIWGIGSPAYWTSGFVVPLNGKIGAVFGSRRIINGIEKSPHNGIDIKGKRGAPVHAISSGKIVLADDLFFGGKTIVIDHGHGLYSFYMHLDGFAAEPGGSVDKNDVVGYVGSTGRATGPHLHIGTKLWGVNVNPLSLTNLKLDDLWR